MGDSVQFACVSFTVKALAAGVPGLQWRGIMAMLHAAMVWLCYGYIMVTLRLRLWLLHQAGDRLCYGCLASQERVNVSAAPTAPRMFSPHFSLPLAYQGFSEQCTQ